MAGFIVIDIPNLQSDKWSFKGEITDRIKNVGIVYQVVWHILLKCLRRGNMLI
jgi:hypothetical protein